MSTPKRLNFSGNVNSPPSLRKSEEEPSKKKKKLASPVIWNEDDEIPILKGLIDYRLKTRNDPIFDWDGFFNFVKGSIQPNVTKKQVFSKIKMLKKIYFVNMERISKGLNPHFTRDTDSQAFGYAFMLWDQDEADVANTSLETAWQTQDGGEETFREDKQVVDVEPLKETCIAKSDFDDIKTEKETTGKESHDSENLVATELSAVKDAFESLMFQGLSDYQMKLQLERLMNLGTEKRKELSKEWKDICDEEANLNIKKLRLSVKLAEAANDGSNKVSLQY